MTRPARLALALAAVSLMPGCAALGALGGGGPPRDAYELRGPLPGERPPARTSLHVIVEPPIVTGALDTDRILIRPNRLQAQYLPDGNWTDKPAEMLQAALVRAIDGSGAFRYVGREPLGLGGDYALVTEITDFQAEVGSDGRVTDRLRVSAKLVRESDVDVIAQRIFDVAVPVASSGTLDIVAALDGAMTAIVAQMTEWTVATLT
ncbi:hypothetical protein GI374_08760 [Paracoccus sp. S-4012]|uniref:ABC-type transport auxiliary lipoprotein family protein n=1 Tax=Paracoccus sp. S-4012 TaxID=2665648 RepID=UPI0012AFBFAE|nr:ABC-type transport auxiliary lipoprotein family protein [Paracoccus sp. S-4012]MRX50531.1 hypothetical protein [Paracoccus sp. S-4012]